MCVCVSFYLCCGQLVPPIWSCGQRAAVSNARTERDNLVAVVLGGEGRRLSAIEGGGQPPQLMKCKT